MEAGSWSAPATWKHITTLSVSLSFNHGLIFYWLNPEMNSFMVTVGNYDQSSMQTALQKY